jgi:ribosomal protein S17
LPYHQTEIEDINVAYSPNNAGNSKHARRLSLIIQHFWNRRKSEYLTPLRELHKKHGDDKINIKVGDTVQIHDDKPRNTPNGNRWTIRSAIVRTNNVFFPTERETVSAGNSRQ